MDSDQIDDDAPLSVAFNYHKKLQQTKPKTNVQVSNSMVALADVAEHLKSGDISSSPQASPQDSIPLPLAEEEEEEEEEEEDATGAPPQISVSLFDYSVENHLKSLHTMFKLCGEHATPSDFNQDEIQHLSSITFLKEWTDFSYKPKTIRFAWQDQSMNTKNVTTQITLPQFSSVAVPQDLNSEKSVSSQPSEDVVVYVGGSVWALDWCPGAIQQSVSGMRMEFVAVASHPPGSLYHKIGSLLTGRGAVQIWCILDASTEESNSSKGQKKYKTCYQKRRSDHSNPASAKKPRGRPKKHRTSDTSDNIKSGSHVVNSPATQCPMDSSSLAANEIASADTYEGDSVKKSEDVPAHVQKMKKCVNQKGQTDGLNSSAATKMGERQRRKARNEALNNVNNGRPLVDPHPIQYPGVEFGTISVGGVGSERVAEANNRSSPPLKSEQTEYHVPLPRMMLCLAHNGEVVWDLKWQPSNSHDKLRLGYLAVVLGNGSIEVWEVPCPHAVQVIYNSSSQLECTDPRFIKLQPVFRCSNFNWGNKKSTPLTVGWSTSSPHDMFVAGCHDGVVALFKFSAAVSCRETKPLLCFNADTCPIRTLAWAPAESSDASNVIVTGGNKGLKFWDLRDPFHPLWELRPTHMNILSLDWLPDPRCVLVSFDDGTLRVVSLTKAANDVPVTGKPFSGTSQRGCSSYLCSSFSIWDVHVSRKTGIVAYCGVDGNALRFQLTTRAVEKPVLRNRNPHFLCGSLREDESEFTIIIPQHDTPFPMKKSLNEWADAPKTLRGFLHISNQEKRAKEENGKNKILDEQPQALCYGDDPRGKFDMKPSVSPKTKQAHDLATKRTSKADEKALTCINGNPEMSPNAGENPETSQNATEQQHDVDEIDRFPPKSIAIHRVRWNMNKGSERWLCYGGAAGIVRLQKVNTSIC